MSNNNNLSREEIAEIEIGKTDITPSVKWFLVIAFLFTIVAIPLAQYLPDLKAGNQASLLPKAFAALSNTGGSGEEEFRQEASLVDTFRLTRGLNAQVMRNIKEFEKSLEEESWLLETAAPAMETVLIRALRGGSRDVYCGRDGWLFFRPTIEYLTGRGFLDPAVMQRRCRADGDSQEPVQPDPVKAIVDFRNQLARRGIELVVLPAPAKATIYPEQFSARYAKVAVPLQNPSYREFLRRLESQGVRVFDPAPILFQAKGKEGLFLKTDTHWSPAGAELVAHGLADYLGKNGLLPQRTPAEYTRVAGKVENAGDLAKMLKIPDAYGYGKEQAGLHPVQQPDGTPWAPSRDADILFLGDSYANIFSLDGMSWGEGSGFVQQLGYYLQRPVDTILINDKGSFTTRQQLGRDLKRGEDRLAGKRVVIYEFATRELAVGDWKLVDLALGKKAETAEKAGAAGTPDAAAAGQGEVEGVIEEITQPPRPGSTAYKDAVIAIHLKDVKAGGKPFKRSQAVIFAWGMRDNVITPASRYKRGQRVALKVRPWGEVEQKYGSYQRIELQNDDAVFLDIFWLMQPEDERDPAPVRATVLATIRGGSQGSAGETLESKQLLDAKAQKQQPPPASVQPVTGDVKGQFQKRIEEIKGLQEGQTRVYPGKDGWLFSRQEISHIAKGQFWGEAAQSVSLAAKPDSRDPLPAILDFKQQLDRAGIELIVVPVPAKAHVYPDKLMEGIQPGQVGADSRLDLVHQQFLAILGKAGVEYLDLTRLFLDARKGGGSPVFLQTDTHWSPHGIALVAHALRQKIASRPWFQALPKQQFIRKEETVKVKGDLLDDSAGAPAGSEAVTVSQVLQILSGRETSPVPDRNSPIVLLGDSHTLIFHAGGDMHAKGGGLPENLAYELGMNVDLVGVRGSGATPARVELARRRDNMNGKKLAIWCFTVREYTESITGWRKVPVIR